MTSAVPPASPAPAPVPSAPSAFPLPDALARAFYQEAVRHLGDAYMLHNAKRFPGSITSTLKASELGIKAVLILDGAFGWWDKLQITHAPLTAIESHISLKKHFQRVAAQDAGLPASIKSLEKLVPGKLGAGSFNELDEANTEYPFAYAGTDPATNSKSVVLKCPGDYFTDVLSRDHYTAARDLLLILQAEYPGLNAMAIVLPVAI